MSRFQSPTIGPQAMSACRSLIVRGVRAAASPTASRRRTTASWSSRSDSNAVRSLLATRDGASRAWSSMCRRRTSGSRRLIQRVRFGEDVITEERADKSGRIQIDPTPQDRGELILHGEEGEAGNVVWLELDEHVNGAVRAEVIPQHRAEQRQSSDVVPSAEVC